MSSKSFLNLMIYLSLFFPFSGFSAWSNHSEGHVGEIRYSILTEEQFQELYGREWELMNGQPLDSGSKLRALWGKGNLPDARGVFLRCKNNGRSDGRQNPGGDLAVGTYQADQFKSHNHSISVRGQVFYNRFRNDGDTWPGGMAPGPVFDDAQTKGIARDYIPDTNGAGGSETNPRCITVNAFIKVKESPLHPKAEKTLSQKIQEITQHPDFKAALATSIRKIIQQRN